MKKDTFEYLHHNFDEYLIKRLCGFSQDANVFMQTEEDIKQFHTVMKSVAYDVSMEYKETSRENILEISTNFNRRFIEYWGYPISLSDAFAGMSFDICKEIKVQRDEEHIVIFVLSKLAGKAIKTYSEINVLLKNGYPQGAMALSRIISEIMVISRFIKVSGEKVALDFHNEVHKPMDQKYDNYEWARKGKCFCDRKGKISFGMIKKETLSGQKISQNDEYAVLCKYAHASAQTIIREPHLFDEVINAGPSMHGIEKPAIISSSMLGIILLDLFEYFSDNEVWRRLHFMMGWAFIMRDEYRIVADKI